MDQKGYWRHLDERQLDDVKLSGNFCSKNRGNRKKLLTCDSVQGLLKNPGASALPGAVYVLYCSTYVVMLKCVAHLCLILAGSRTSLLSSAASPRGGGIGKSRRAAPKQQDRERSPSTFSFDISAFLRVTSDRSIHAGGGVASSQSIRYI